METSAGESLMSMRPFVVTKCSARLVSRVSPSVWGYKPSYTESATISYRTHLSSSPYYSTHAHTHTQNLCSQYCGKTKQPCRNVCTWSSHLGSRVQTERDGTRAETRFGLPAKRTSPFISAGVSVQSSTGFLGVRVGRERL